MSVSTLRKCDRCGKTFSLFAHRLEIRKRIMFELSGSSIIGLSNGKLDLCSKCKDDFEIWLKQPAEEIHDKPEE